MEKKMKKLQEGFESAGPMEDPLVKKIKGLFSSDEDAEQTNGKSAQLEAIKKKRQALGV